MATTQAVSPAAVRGPQTRMPSGTGPIPADAHSPRNSPRPMPTSRMAPDEAAAWERKRRTEEEARYAVSPQSRHIPLRGGPPPQQQQQQQGSGQGTPTAPYVGPAPRSSRASPHTQLPSFNNLTSAQQQQPHDAESAKRRRAAMEADGMEAGGPGYSYADEEEEAYRARERARRAQPPQQQQHQQQPGSNGRYSPPGARSVYAGGAPPGEVRAPHDESYDSSIPLSRRRGDVAHAKASRLHIDVGASSPNADQLSAGSRRGPGTGPLARSAPPHQITFDDAGPVPVQHPAYHPAGIPPPPSATAHPAYRYEERYLVGGPAGSPPQRITALRPTEAPGSRSLGPPPPASARFVPQTATLPSPAYHTTAFMRGSTGMPTSIGAPAPGPSGPPRTAGLVQPPHTARLPDHLRSPPSSKTQFLSLFSNFYDSLSDSRTLKATLEDQVRRSNTLLQTLQRSSRVLDATVDRRIREERGVWEGRVFGLEARVRELEAKLGLPSSTSTSNAATTTAASVQEARAASTSPHAPLKPFPTPAELQRDERRTAAQSSGPAPPPAENAAAAKAGKTAAAEDEEMGNADDEDDELASAETSVAP